MAASARALAQRACSTVTSGHVQLTSSQPHPSVALWSFLKMSRKRDARENIWSTGERWFVSGSCLHSFQLLLAEPGDSAHVQNTPAAQVAAFVHLTSVFFGSCFLNLIIYFVIDLLTETWLVWATDGSAGL